MINDIKESYDSAKKLAKQIWIDGDNEGNGNDYYYFECGFIAGLSYSNTERYKSKTKRLKALEELSKLDQELGSQ